MNITPNELAVLRSIATSEYQDGEPTAFRHVWTSYINPFPARRTLSGVVASLVKKGLVVTGGSEADANYSAGCDGTTVALTDTGLETYRNH